MRPVSSSLFRGLAPSSAARLRTPAERIPVAERFYHPPRTSTATATVTATFVRPSPALSSLRWRQQPVRFNSANSNAATSTTAPDSRLQRDQVPAYELTFTCKVCSTRSSHRVSKQGYHHGTVLISCPGCKNRHLMSDHMKIFSDNSITVEDILREKGSLVKRGTLSDEGDVEFWDDGTTTDRSSHFHHDSNTKSDPDATEGSLTTPSASEKAP